MSTKKSNNDLLAKKKHPVARNEVLEALSALQQKVSNSAALNGGFDRLLFKIDKIEENQVLMGVKVDSIHEAIYHPDDGLFARVKIVEQAKEKLDDVKQLEKDVLVLQQHQIEEEKNLSQDSLVAQEHEKLIKTHADVIDELIKFKTSVCSIAKWGLVTIAGGSATLIGKLIYDFVSGHITVH